VGWSPPRERFRLTLGSDDPRAGLRLARGLDAASRARPCLGREPSAPSSEFPSPRGVNRLAASILAPPAGAFNALTFAGAKSKTNPRHYAPGNHAPALLRQLPWRSHPRHCATLCGVVSNRPAGLYHPLPYGRRTTPSNPHADGPRASDLYATPLKPLLDAHRTRHDALPEARFARTTVYSMELYAIPPHVARTVWHACKLLPPWPVKGGVAP
jgi:hypothetical protein